jgi:2-polyprenyl-6-hydroxyphenyl methylase/3-demethylubiquinone-9 3-methyltransferase
MNDLETSRRLHSGAYVDQYERKPVSRLQRLVPMLGLQGHEELADFACGNAMLLPLVHDRVRSYVGVDFSPDFIRAAHRRAAAHAVTNCSFHCEDIVEFCARNPQRFDVATAFDFSEHVRDDDFVRIFSAIRASLKSGGRLWLHTPNLDFFLERMKEAGILRQFPEHVAVRTAAAHHALLVRCGFASDRIRSTAIAHYNVLRAVHPLRHVPIVGRYFAARLVIECTR